MSIQHRLLIIYTIIFSAAYVAFAVLIYWLPRNQVLAQIDNDLKQLAQEVTTASTMLGPDGILHVRLPNDLVTLQTASTFLVILDRDHSVAVRSNNMASHSGVFDPSGLGRVETYRLVQYEETSLRVHSRPVFSPDGRLIGHIQVARLLDNFERFNSVLGRVLFLGMIVAMASWLTAVFLTPGLFRPLGDITTVARQITRADDLGRRVPHANRVDEIGELARAFNQTLERLERLFRSQQRFLADVSHELRTPLTSVRGNLDLMSRMGEYDAESMAVVRDEIERMTRLVGDLLLLARADSGGFPLQRAPVELDNILFEVYRQVDRLEKSVRLELTDVDQVVILGDSDRLKQLLLNLVDNAIKYTSPGGQVSLSLSQQNDWAHLSVSDSGIGIPPEDLPHIFDRFYRVDKARTRTFGGSGLGLAIARWIAQAHGGNIHVKSKVDEGTTFTVTLPIYRGRPKLAAAEEQEEKTRPGFRVLAPTLRRQG